MDFDGSFKKGDVVYILDYPFGHPLNVKGIVVGTLHNDHYNVKITNGIRTGDIAKYKYWNLILEEEVLDTNNEK